MRHLDLKTLCILFLIILININCSGYCDPEDLTRDQKDKNEAQIQMKHKDSVDVKVD